MQTKGAHMTFMQALLVLLHFLLSQPLLVPGEHFLCRNDFKGLEAKRTECFMADVRFNAFRGEG